MKSEKIVARLDKEKAALDLLLAPLTPAQIGAPSTPEDWSLKDHLAHLAMWAAGIVALLQQQPRMTAMGLLPELAAATHGTDAINAVIYAQHAAETVEQVRALFDTTHAHFRAAILQTGDEGLARPYHDYDAADTSAAGKRPVSGWVLGDGAAHYAQHRRWMEAIIARSAGA